MSSMYGATGSGMGDKIPKGYQAGRLQQFTPEQMKLLQSMFGTVGEGSYLSRLAGGDEDIFNEIEAPALRQFTGIQGNTASRFSGQGQGGRHSSGFQNTLNAQGSEFAQNLAAQRHGLQRNAIKDLWGMQESLLGQRPYENFLTEEEPSFLDSLFGSLGSGAGQAGGMAGMLKLLKSLGLM